MTKPDNFRRDREWYCPICRQPRHSVEQMQICYASHTDDERADHAFLESKRQVFALVRVGER